MSSGDRPYSEEVNKHTFLTTFGGLVGLNRPTVQHSEQTAMKLYTYLICPGVGFRLQCLHWKKCSNMPRGCKKKEKEYLNFVLYDFCLTGRIIAMIKAKG